MAGDRPESTRCPNCHAEVAVPADWRLVQCPHCGHTMTRMTDDPAFD